MTAHDHPLSVSRLDALADEAAAQVRVHLVAGDGEAAEEWLHHLLALHDGVERRTTAVLTELDPDLDASRGDESS